ncbi:MAG TPA: gluconate 2-dehydrogenase subunit 3 family protein [Terriglobia bacterium]
MSGQGQDGKAGLGRREMLRRLMVGAGAASAAALPGAGPSSAQAASGHGTSTAPSGMRMPAAGSGASNAPAMALGAAEPPDPGLSAADWKPKFFDDHQAATVLAVGDLLIPETDTPGARTAHADRFVDLLLSTDAPGTDEDAGSDFTDVLLRKGSIEAQKRYLAALNWLDGYCLAQYSKPFTELARPERETVLDLLTYSTSSPALAPGREHFGLIRSSIVAAYYSSEIGTLQELKYQTNPYQTGVPDDCHPKS